MCPGIPEHPGGIEAELDLRSLRGGLAWVLRVPSPIATGARVVVGAQGGLEQRIRLDKVGPVAGARTRSWAQLPVVALRVVVAVQGRS